MQMEIMSAGVGRKTVLGHGQGLSMVHGSKSGPAQMVGCMTIIAADGLRTRYQSEGVEVGK